ncbi:hypothetical protein [Sphingomonas sp. SRS2]|uniref:hypothetical protein n=1 Tax=Sphingomonas sp. SRS2 TaxID=133190 RepID=UPI000618498D|nr:hypothetical protein [Sphingomonas sp. SRS2]KKC27327.1 hypothetical protein WP12_04060 [Sphingomonas sp. SRS2]
MTTIATDGATLAGDGLLCMGEGKVRISLNYTKVHRAGESVFGFAGDPSACERFRAWMNGNRDEAFRTSANFAAIILENGAVFVVEGDGYFSAVEAPFAIGSGASFAMGAMAAGADAETAVKIASRFDTITGGSIVAATANKSDAGRA